MADVLSEKKGNHDNVSFLKTFNSGNDVNYRKKSTDFSYPFNFINDNSIFLSAAKNFFRKPFDEKDFKIIFDNSFKFETKEFHEDDSSIEIILLDNANSFNNTQSNYNGMRKISNEMEVYEYNLDNNRDIIDEFLHCS